jgi:hypothetical protein
MRRVSVEWIDATSTLESGWKSLSEIVAHLTPSKSHFTGWVLHEEKDYIIFAAHKIGEGADEAFDGDLCLPRGCITSMVEVTNEPKKRRPGNAAGASKRVGPKKRCRSRGN